MIKIELTNHDTIEKEYFSNVKNLIIKRLENLHFTLSCLNYPNSILNIPNLISVNPITRKTIHLIEANNNYDKYFPTKNYTKETYIEGITEYINNPNNLDKSLIQNLIKLIEYLLTEQNLKKLITCKPEKLENHQDSLLRNFFLITSINSKNDLNRNLIKLAFDYEYKEIGTAIRTFFRSHNFVHYCPYCNLNEVKHLANDTGKTAASHELDHFFDKASNPLLCLSLYNLIPSDSTCNKTNKGTIPFSNEFHLNPYIEGANDYFNFKPILGTNNKVIDIDLTFKTSHPISIKKLIGTKQQLDENSIEGNFNVFKIKTKYKNKLTEATNILQRIKRDHEGKRSISIFLNQLKKSADYEKHKEWYEDIIETPFEPYRFHEKALSKLNKDIHDYYFENYKKDNTSTP